MKEFTTKEIFYEVLCRILNASKIENVKPANLSGGCSERTDVTYITYIGDRRTRRLNLNELYDSSTRI